MWQMVFANVSVKGWVIDPYEQDITHTTIIMEEVCG